MSFERTSIDPDRVQGVAVHPGHARDRERDLGATRCGSSIDEVIADYPQLERQDVLGALEYAAATTRDREIPLTAAG